MSVQLVQYAIFLSQDISFKKGENFGMSDQKMIIANEECDFIVKNYDAIQSLKEGEKRAEQKVPLWMKRKLKQILDLKLDGKWQVEESDDKSGHYDQLSNETYYKDKDEVGYYFYIGNFTLEEFAIDDEDDGCQVYLCCNFSKKKKQEWKDWNNAVTAKIKNSTSAITKLGYKVFPDNDEDEDLVAKGLLNDLNIKVLAEDPEESIKKTADSVIKFINDMLKYLVALPEE